MSAEAVGSTTLTSEFTTNPGIGMSLTLVVSDPTAVKASVRARRAGRRLVLLRGPTDVDRMFALAGSPDRVERGDLDRGVPSIGLLLELDDGDLAS